MEHFFVIFQVAKGPQTEIRKISIARAEAANKLLVRIGEERDKIREAQKQPVYVIQVMQLVDNPARS